MHVAYQKIGSYPTTQPGIGPCQHIPRKWRPRATLLAPMLLLAHWVARWDPLAHVSSFLVVATDRLLEGRVGSCLLSSGEYVQLVPPDTAFAVAQIFSVISRNFQCLDLLSRLPSTNAGSGLMARLVLSGCVDKGGRKWCWVFMLRR